MDETTQKFLSVRDLEVIYTSGRKTVHAVNGISFDMDKGETLALVGETGAGKTTIAKAILGILPNPPARLKQGRIILEGEDLLKKPAEEMLKIRGGKIAMIFQDPMTALNPIMTVGEQIVEGLLLHNDYTRREAEEEAGKMLELVGIPAERFAEYPFEFSGGMKQRVVIAMALACSPDLLLADEPTTALDVTIQAQVLEMMRRLKDKYHTATLLITHDLGVVAQMCEKVAIIYAGEVVESGAVLDIYKHTLHPYTEGLLGAIPQVHLHVHRLSPIDGLMPDPTAQRTGCPFADRCKYAFERCHVEHPRFIDAGNGHRVRCFKVENELRKGAGE